MIHLPPNFVEDHLEYEVKGIFKCRNYKRKEKEYLVKWQGYHEIEATWKVLRNMINAKEIVKRSKEIKARGSNKKKHRH